MRDRTNQSIPLYIPHSNTTTAANKTGSWRFFHPRLDEKTAPCSAACPVGQDIARIEMLVARGLLKDAWHLIMDENPFPAVCGRVCFHPCEKACNRSRLDAPIAIRQLERFVGDTALSKNRKPSFPKPADRKQQVAIAGAGPSGLSAAYFLTRLGYRCVIYETKSSPGGLLRTGIPAYRLPRNILDLEIGRIEQLGVSIQCATPVTENLLNKIDTEFDALFVGCGYGQSIRLPIDGGHLALDGLDVLSRLHHGEAMAMSGRILIIGGGNTAVDLARCLQRIGASPKIVYRRRIKDMPAHPPELELAFQEGIDIMELASPVGIRPNSQSSGTTPPGYSLILQHMKVGGAEISGRAHVIPDGEKQTTISAQNIIAAIGARPHFPDSFSATAGTGTLDLSHCKLILKKTPYILGGDLASPVKSVAHAIASGKQAALALNSYFEAGLEAVMTQLSACQVGSGPGLSVDAYATGKRKGRNPHIVSYDEIGSDYFKPRSRVMPSILPADRRRRSFDEVEPTLSGKPAKEEASRCFNCGFCNACDYCRLYCPEMAVKVEKGLRSIDMEYCKGCGVCAAECPRNAMALEEEVK
jgi:NADPH-dependent glutamate synthase beta subunit-like oxidoreductase/Pyruvate/2-oxoacid:ferredoxin oxidoreductase delta subunit